MIPAVRAVVPVTIAGAIALTVAAGATATTGTRTAVGRSRMVALRSRLLRGTRSATAVGTGPVLRFSHGNHQGRTHYHAHQFCQYSFHSLNIIYVLEQIIDKRFKRAFKNKR